MTQKVNKNMTQDTNATGTKTEVSSTVENATVSHMLGEMVWLLTQSPIHKHMSLSDLEWMIMPALLLEQFRVFRDGQTPLGYVTWGYLDEEAEEKLNAAGRLSPHQWRAGGLNAVHLKGSPLAAAADNANSEDTDHSEAASAARQGQAAARSVSEDISNEGTLWIVDFVAPGATADNKLVEIMMADLMQGPFKGKTFKFHKTNPDGKREVMEIKA